MLCTTSGCFVSVLIYFLAYQLVHPAGKTKNVFTDNHSGISARQRDSKVSMTDRVSAEDDVNLRVSTGLSATIDEGRRRRL